MLYLVLLYCLQYRKVAGLVSSSSSYNDLRYDCYILSSFYLIKPNVSLILNTFSAYIYILLALRNIRIFSCIKVILYVKVFISLVNCLTAWKILVKEFFFSIISIYIYYYHIATDNLYYEVCFIEVVKILLLDRILYIYIGY